jgi:hypothetical protein
MLFQRIRQVARQEASEVLLDIISFSFLCRVNCKEIHIKRSALDDNGFVPASFVGRFCSREEWLYSRRYSKKTTIFSHRSFISRAYWHKWFALLHYDERRGFQSGKSWSICRYSSHRNAIDDFKQLYFYSNQLWLGSSPVLVP